MTLHEMPPSCDANTLIKVTPGVTFKFHSWGDEHIVYNNFSGNTHLVDELTYYTLQCVNASLNEAQTIYQQVAEVANMELDDELKSYLTQVISSLAQKNLIELQST